MPELLILPQTSEDLNALTWAEIAEISAKAAKDPTPYLYMTDQDHKLEKDIDLSSIGYSSTVKARIIGVRQGMDEDGHTVGITFQLCDGLTYGSPTAMCMNLSDDTSGGWETCQMRKANLPMIEAALPEELKSRLRKIRKKTNMTSIGSTLKQTMDKLFLLSNTEVFGDDQAPNSSDTPWCKGEGEWYQWYKSHNTNQDRIINMYNSGYPWWLRSVSSSTNFGYVGSDGKWGSVHANYSTLPCACFAV